MVNLNEMCELMVIIAKIHGIKNDKFSPRCCNAYELVHKCKCVCMVELCTKCQWCHILSDSGVMYRVSVVSYTECQWCHVQRDSGVIY